jgi:hypothetical protein
MAAPKEPRKQFEGLIYTNTEGFKKCVGCGMRAMKFDKCSKCRQKESFESKQRADKYNKSKK